MLFGCVYIRSITFNLKHIISKTIQKAEHLIPKIQLAVKTSKSLYYFKQSCKRYVIIIMAILHVVGRGQHILSLHAADWKPNRTGRVTFLTNLNQHTLFTLHRKCSSPH